MSNSKNELKKHRIIGIKHVLKSLKKEELIDDDITYADDAADDLVNKRLNVAERWYLIGARRGISEFINALLEEQFELQKGENREIELVAKTDSIKWSRKLKVKIGSKTESVAKKKHKITISELGFE